MALSAELLNILEHFLEVIHEETGFPVLIYDQKGRIMKATERDRVGDLHAGGQQIMQYQADDYAVTKEEAVNNPLIKEGYSCPITYQNERVAGFGITGKLELVEPLAKVASRLLNSMLQEFEHKQAIKLSEEKYCKAFSNSPIWVVLSSRRTGRYIEVNENFLNTMGYTREEVIGRTSLDINSWVNPDDRKAILKIIAAKGRVRDYEVNRRTKSGDVLTMLFSAEIIEVSGETCLLSVSQNITVRKQVEEDLRLSENNLRITLNSIGDAVITTDTDGRITRMNPMAEQLTGWSADEAVGIPLPEVFHIINAHTRAPEINPAKKVLENGEAVGLANDTVLIHRDGREYQVADSGAPIRGVDGRIEGVVLVFRDISETYAQSKKIQDSQRQLNNISSNLPGVVYEFQAKPDHQYTASYVSEKIVEYFGLDASPEHFFNQFYACIPDEEKAGFVQSIREAVDNMTPWEYEGRFNKPNGNTIWFSGSSSPVQEGDTIIFYGVLMDITEQKDWQQVLAASERRYRDLFNEAPVMYVITENRENEPYIQDVNHMFTDLLGYSRQQVVDMPLKKYYSAESVIELTDGGGYQRALKGEFIAEERTFITNSGEPVNTLLHALPQMDESGRVKGTRAMFLDITARKHAENEALRLETALAQSQKMEAIGTLAGGIAHDFNNILSAVIGYTELTLADIAKETHSHQNLEQVLIAGMRAKDLVSQILTFSRRDESELQLKPIQVKPLVKEALKLLRSSLPSTIEIIQNIEPDLDNVMADPVQLHQIMMNLCTNASHAMDENGGRLTVGLSKTNLTQEDLQLNPDLKPGNYIKLSVQDTGSGISKEIIDKIFNPYFTTKDKGEGTGLGLSVVQGIVQSYNGAIAVYSEPGQGTTFNVYLPTIKLAALKEKTDVVDLPTGREHILFVDDEPILVELSRQMLERLGYKVTTCTNGIDALAIFQQAPDDVDLVLSDLTMPKLAGDKLAAKMLQIRPDLPIVVCTGQGTKIPPNKAAEIGIRKVIKKPFVVQNIAKAVRDVLDEVV